MPATAWAGGNVGGLTFKPTALPVAKVGVKYQVVISISIQGHHPALNKPAFADYQVDCFGANQDGAFVDDCNKLPPGLKIKPFADPGKCSPPLVHPACIVLQGTPKKAGRFTFRIFAPDVKSISVRGVHYDYTVIVRR